MVNPNAPKVEIESIQVGHDPEITIFHVTLLTDDGVWEETFGCAEQLKAFLRGARAGCGMLGVQLPLIELPWGI